LLDNGQVIVSEKFTNKFPQFLGTDWYFCDGSLVDEETFDKHQTGQKQAHPAQEERDEDTALENREIDDEDDVVSEPTSKSFLPYFALSNLAMKCGITSSLTATFGKMNGRKYLDYAIYLLLESGTADCYEDWAFHQLLSADSVSMDGREISKLLQLCTDEEWDKFWKERYEHSKAAHSTPINEKVVRFCAFDSTSISTYSTMDDAAFGHAKQDPNLKQINLATIVDQFSGDLVYAFTYDGSINDKATYAYAISRMTQAGFPMQEIILITDRGYYSNYNGNMLLQEGIHYLSGVPISQNSVEEKWILDKGQDFKSDPVFWNPLYEVAHYTLPAEKWKIDGIERKTFTHVYYSPRVATEQNTELNNMVTKTLDSLRKKQPVDPQQMQQARPYLHKVPKADGNCHKEIEKVWDFNHEPIRRFQGRAGYFVLKSDIVEDPITALSLYRLRNGVEQGFDQLKNSLGGRRLNVQNKAHKGKLLAVLIGTALRLMIRYNLERHQHLCPASKVQIPGNSVTKLMRQLDRVQVTRAKSNEAWVCGLVPKRMRDWLGILLECPVPPREFKLRGS
jgi:transposase